MTHKEEGRSEYLTMPAAIVIAGALIGLGLYMGGKAMGGGSFTATAQAPAQQQAQQGNQQPPQAVGDVDPVTAADHILGNPKAKVFIVEYSDPECPFCKMLHPTLKGIADKYSASGEVAWVYRNFPIDSLHPKARKVSEATECAAELGGNSAFWKFYDNLFATTPGSNGIDEAQLSVIAKDTGLDVKKFDACVSSGKYAKKVEDSIQSGIRAGVNGTPTSFVVYGDTVKPLVGAVPAEQFQTIIDEALK